MSEQKKPEPGIDLEKVTFDADGQVAGLDEETLESIAGGLMDVSCDNGACGNTANGVKC